MTCRPTRRWSLRSSVASRLSSFLTPSLAARVAPTLAPAPASRMARAVLLARAARVVVAVLLLAPVHGGVAWAAQAPAAADDVAGTITGEVVDDTGLALPGARVSVLDGEGRPLGMTVTTNTGAFSLAVPAGSNLTVVAALPSFLDASVPVPPTGDGPRQALRLVLRTGGFAEQVVVTARRVEGRASETVQRVEVITEADVERTVAADVADVLKKNAGVDVIQFSGALSGIGIRGFRPQFSGINKRSLLLVDGRPSGITNLATLFATDVERIEVLKGAASALYGSSAMGGVVNVITRESRGPLAASARLGGGSFGTSDVSARVGGALTSRVDADLGGSAVHQRNDFRMGNGEMRPATSFGTWDGTGRLGVSLGAARAELRAAGYRGRDILTPGDLASGILSQGSKDLDRSSLDARLRGVAGGHALSVTAYRTRERSDTSNVTSFDPSDAPFLPYLAFGSDVAWSGLQLRDAWTVSQASSLVIGLDYEQVSAESRNYTRTGERSAPFSADARKRSTGLYAEHTWRAAGGATVVALGGRLDHIANETVDTPLKTNFTPSEAAFVVFSPSAGVTQALGRDVRLHASLGRAFIPAEASQLTGFTTNVFGGRTQITQGNPDLRPERSTSFDAGLAWAAGTSRLDVTLFHTRVSDRFISNIVISDPPPPAPVVVSVANGLGARITGVEFEAGTRVGGHVGLFANTTHYLTRTEELADGRDRDILNVARNTVRAGVDLDFGALSTRVTGRYVQGRKDNDFNLPGFPVVANDDFTVVDASASYRLTRGHALVVQVNNLFDANYYEVLGYPLQGASFKAFYRFGL